MKCYLKSAEGALNTLNKNKKVKAKKSQKSEKKPISPAAPTVHQAGYRWKRLQADLYQAGSVVKKSESLRQPVHKPG